MKNYIGTKRLKAEPMTRKAYCDYRGWDLPMNENGDDEGYLVEYLDGGKENHPNHSGYISWSPKNVFEAAYRETNSMTIGEAIEALKKGYKVARSGWNGKSMYVVLMPGYPEGIEVNEKTREAHNLPKGAILKFMPYMQLFTDKNDVVMWFPNGSDLLAEDWKIIE